MPPAERRFVIESAASDEELRAAYFGKAPPSASAADEVLRESSPSWIAPL